MDVSGFVEHYPQLLREAHRIVRNFDDAQDVAQQTVCDAIDCCEELRDPARLTSWLHVINRRNALDLFKIRRRRRKHLANIGLVKQRSQADDGESQHVVSTAIARLKSRDKYVLEERYLNGAKISEIGMKLGATPGAVRTSLVRARRKLKFILRSNPMDRTDRAII